MHNPALTVKVDRFSLHCDGRLYDEAPIERINMFLQTVRSIRVGDAQVFEYIENDDVIFEIGFLEEVSLQEFRAWADWLQARFLSIVEG